MQKIISKIIVLIYTVVMITSLAACHKEEETKLPQQLYTSVIIADFSNGAIDLRERSLKEKNVEMNRQPTIGELASVLGQWVGLDFALNEFKIEGEKAYVDWAINSTLVAGLGERKQKEEFFFDDASSLNWFMMDSLARTIKANFPVNKVYYSQGGGNLLTFSQGQEIGFNALPLEQSYEGSAFFIAQSSLSKEKSSPVTYTPEAKPENYDFPITDVPVYSPDILRLRNASYGEMPTFDNQNDVARYVLYQFLNNRFELEFYLHRSFAVDEGNSYDILFKACEAAMTYYLFSAYRENDILTQDRGDKDKVYAKIKIVYTRPEYDLEAKAEALEFIMKNPIPNEGFTDFEAEKAYAKKIHDFIAKKVTYSPIGYNPESMLGLEKYEAFQEAYNVLSEEQNTAVCAGYARGFALIAQYAGINAAWVFGNEREIQSHAWNVIYPCDGSEPVLVDVTWDDTESEDTAGQKFVEDRCFYVPLSKEYEHKASGHFQEFLSFINRK